MTGQLLVTVIDESQVAGLGAIGVLNITLELPEKIALSIEITGYEGCRRAAGSCLTMRIVSAAKDVTSAAGGLI